MYIVDTGIDANHVEFAPSAHAQAREVVNIYNAFGAVSTNTDGQGHGTHCAGTIGGLHVGVARDANLYGVKALGNDGSALTSDVIAGLEFVKTHWKERGMRPSVVTMSLGGACDNADCQKDSLVLAVEALAALGVVSSIASGNENCNACAGSPNAAPSAINVGALGKTSSSDGVTTYHKASFSDYGQCIDVFAPGESISSAYSNKDNTVEDRYAMMSGTSMACPHVTGVVAQLLQQEYERGPGVPAPSDVADVIGHRLSCDAEKNVVGFEARDTVTRNLAVQVASVVAEGGDGSCNLGDGCSNDCGGEGLCQAPHSSSSASKYVDEQPSCHCEQLWYGDDCAAARDPLCSALGHVVVPIYMGDAGKDGWNYATFAITANGSDVVVDSAIDGLCFEGVGSRTYCLQEGCYNFDVTAGRKPTEITWEMCGGMGGAPFAGSFCVANGTCQFACDASSELAVDLLLSDSESDGWNGASFRILTAEDLTGSNTARGTLSEAEADGATLHLCLDKTVCSYVMLEDPGSYPNEISFFVCGVTAYANDVIEVCGSEVDGSCVAQLFVPDAATGSNGTDTCPTGHSALSLSGFSFARDQTWPDSFAITVEGTSVGGDTVSLSAAHPATPAFAFSEQLCLPDGCYAFGAGEDTHHMSSLQQKQVMWHMCGNLREGPLTAGSLCVEEAFDFCYGLSPCPVLKSYAHAADYQHYLMYSKDVGNEPVAYYLESGEVHGLRELCDLDKDCFEVCPYGHVYMCTYH